MSRVGIHVGFLQRCGRRDGDDGGGGCDCARDGDGDRQQHCLQRLDLLRHCPVVSEPVEQQSMRQVRQPNCLQADAWRWNYCQQ